MSVPVVVGLCLIVGGVAAGFRPARVEEREVTGRPISVPDGGFISSDTCQTCHPREYATWHDSFHRTMTQVVTPESVVGDFNGVMLTLGDRRYLLDRKGDEFWVELDDPSAPDDVITPDRVRRRIVMTTGSHHLQVYWFETGDGRRLAQLPFDYRIDEGRWIPDHASFVRPPWPADVRMPVAGPGEWHVGCIQCHTTQGRPRLGERWEGPVETQVVEFGIACESCHGPAGQHVHRHQNPLTRRNQRKLGRIDVTITQPERLDHRASSQVCGQCHSIFTFADSEERTRWGHDGFSYRAGANLTEHRAILRGGTGPGGRAMIEMRRHDPSYELADSFWSDGMVRVSGREYNGLIETPCYQMGTLSCLSCHRMHQGQDDPRRVSDWADDQLRPEAIGDEACLPCHYQYRADPSLHTHHHPGSTGSLCYNCHMPYTTYGLHKAIRSHQVDSPSVDSSVTTGRPNACNQCHLNKSLGWAADYLETWYGIPRPELNEDEERIAAAVIWTLKGDAGQRALMAWSMGWPAAREISGSGWMEVYLGSLLNDAYDAVRYIAFRSLRTIPGYESLAYDPFCSAADRLNSVRQAKDIHRRVSPPPPADATAVLIDENGQPIVEEVLRLLRSQDTRPVMLRE